MRHPYKKGPQRDPIENYPHSGDLDHRSSRIRAALHGGREDHGRNLGESAEGSGGF